MFIKICCISSPAEAELALSHGVDALGLVSSMPSGPGVIPESRIADIADVIADRGRSVLLTSLTQPEAIADQFERCRVNSIQLCDWIGRTGRRRLQSLLPDAFIIQVVHVTGEESVRLSTDAQHHVDALLLDSGNPAAKQVELGGTGRTHDWAISRRIREQCSVPVLLAGGLRAENVRMSIQEVEPDGVDICSGVRTDGVLDSGLLSDFISAVRRRN